MSKQVVSEKEILSSLLNDRTTIIQELEKAYAKGREDALSVKLKNAKHEIERTTEKEAAAAVAIQTAYLMLNRVKKHTRFPKENSAWSKESHLQINRMIRELRGMLKEGGYEYRVDHILKLR